MLEKILVALIDLMGAINKIHLPLMLGWQDIKQRYRRSKLGPFWLTISMGIMITMIGYIFGQAMGLPRQEYLPFVATGMIFWAFISSGINEGSSSFINASGMIRQLSLPLSIYPLRTLWRNVVVLGHNLILLPIALAVAGRAINFNLLWIIPGFILLVLNIFWISVFLGVICTRYRDLPPIIGSLIQVFFYVTPIIWMPSGANSRVPSWILDFNPAYHLLELVRGPVLGYCPSLLSWGVALVSVIFGAIVTLIFYGTYKRRIAYWV